MQHRKTCILIAGVHRSGTSVSARIVNLLGADISPDLLPSNDGVNDRGFWESVALIQIHDELLANLGVLWDHPLPLPENWLRSDAARQAKTQIVDVLREHFSASALFVIKDPRITRLLPLWFEVLQGIEADPLIVIPVRHPAEVVASLEKRDKFSPGKSLLIYLQGYLDTEFASRNHPRLFVSYTKLLSNWRSFAKQIDMISGSRFPPLTQSRCDEIENFIAPDLVHHRFDPADSAFMKDTPQIVFEMFECLSEAAQRCDERRLHAAFDAFQETLAQAALIYQDLTDEIKTAEDKILPLKQEIMNRDKELIRLAVIVKVRTAKLERLQEELQRSNQANMPASAVRRFSKRLGDFLAHPIDWLFPH